MEHRIDSLERETTELVAREEVEQSEAVARSGLDWLEREFEILGVLGSGGMGTVYKVRRKESGNILALKVLKPELTRSAAALRRFSQEATLNLTHENVV
ncbi:MAG: hypothetical protein K2Z81_27085, partial [Cyanobacteria bacterium]|nr:hypothetical protein [Cyanobacteriota bacterium]